MRPGETHARVDRKLKARKARTIIAVAKREARYAAEDARKAERDARVKAKVDARQAKIDTAVDRKRKAAAVVKAKETKRLRRAVMIAFRAGRIAERKAWREARKAPVPRKLPPLPY